MNKFVLLLLLLLTACTQTAVAPPTASITPAATAVATTENIFTAARLTSSIAEGLRSVISEWEKAPGYKVQLLELPYAYLQEKVFTNWVILTKPIPCPPSLTMLY